MKIRTVKLGILCLFVLGMALFIGLLCWFGQLKCGGPQDQVFEDEKEPPWMPLRRSVKKGEVAVLKCREEYLLVIPSFFGQQQCLVRAFLSTTGVFSQPGQEVFTWQAVAPQNYDLKFCNRDVRLSVPNDDEMRVIIMDWDGVVGICVIPRPPSLNFIASELNYEYKKVSLQQVGTEFLNEVEGRH